MQSRRVHRKLGSQLLMEASGLRCAVCRGLSSSESGPAPAEGSAPDPARICRKSCARIWSDMRLTRCRISLSVAGMGSSPDAMRTTSSLSIRNSLTLSSFSAQVSEPTAASDALSVSPPAAPSPAASSLAPVARPTPTPTPPAAGRSSVVLRIASLSEATFSAKLFTYLCMFDCSKYCTVHVRMCI